jgi:putative nucleotidyltransferase with HDIG domain
MGFFSRKKDSSKNIRVGKLSKTSLTDEIRIKQTLGIRKLESMPVQAAQAFQLASDPKSRIDDFVKVIEADEALSARMIRIANSVYFRRKEEAKDIEKAVVNIGLDELRCLISASMLKSLLQGKHPAREQIWANSVGTAVACRSLSSRTNIDEGSAFLCGLLHDVGKLIMIRSSGKEYEKVLKLVADGSTTFPEAEEKVFDLNHIEVGKWIAEQWSFPACVVRAIQFHHHAWATKPDKKGKNTSHAMLVKTADTFAHASGLGLSGAFRGLQQTAREQLNDAIEQIGADKEFLDTFPQTLSKVFQEEFSIYQME